MGSWAGAVFNTIFWSLNNEFEAKAACPLGGIVAGGACTSFIPRLIVPARLIVSFVPRLFSSSREESVRRGLEKLALPGESDWLVPDCSIFS